jgi:hypothetical protein
MISSITFGFLSHGSPVAPNRRINITTDHPGVEDASEALGLTAFLSLVTAVYEAYEGQWKLAGAALLPILKTAYQGSSTVHAISGHETFPHGGQLILGGTVKVIDELRVVFRAESEDDLKDKSSIGVLTHADGTADPNAIHSEQKFTQGGNNVYVSRFGLPLSVMTPGDYLFTFGAQDDGWFFDVAVGSILTLTIAPTRFTRPVPTSSGGRARAQQVL